MVWAMGKPLGDRAGVATASWWACCPRPMCRVGSLPMAFLRQGAGLVLQELLWGGWLSADRLRPELCLSPAEVQPGARRWDRRSQSHVDFLFRQRNSDLKQVRR